MKRASALMLAAAISLPLVLVAQEGGRRESLTGDPLLDRWVELTFGQEIERKAVMDPVWGTRTLAALTDAQREGARLFNQRCNVCHGVGMNSMASYAPRLTQKNVLGRQEAARRAIMEGTPRMPAFKYGLKPEQIDMIIDYLSTLERYEPAY